MSMMMETKLQKICVFIEHDDGQNLDLTAKAEKCRFDYEKSEFLIYRVRLVQ